MLATLLQNNLPIDESVKATHILALLPKLEKLPSKMNLPGEYALKALLLRREMQLSEISEIPVCANLQNGTLCTWVMVDFNKSVFEQHTVIRKALQLLLEEGPTQIHLSVHGNAHQRQLLAKLAVYVTWINGAVLPVRKLRAERKSLESIILYGHEDPDHFLLLRAQAEGNLLARGLTGLPPNELTPKTYREQIEKLAHNENWKYEEYDLATLRKLGAGAFVAVAQGSDTEDAAIVHLQRSNGKKSGNTVALVGKGICYDTGGHNLKPARFMHGMHEDMNGSAVALGVLLAATRADLPINIDCWLAIAQNHISPRAYKQNDVITALSGTTIEIIHTDAEGRLVLADTLTLAEKQKPDLMIDFATLTGSLYTALGSRYSGIFSNREHLIQKALAVGKSSGERVCAFPMDADYEADLESKIADIKQCTLDSDYDHILAARFLSRFIDDVPWLHMDLSACHHKGGLGAVGTDITGFGVAWSIAFLQKFLSN
ncbi:MULTISPECIES: M17 family metallopeptidase [Nitrosomonas]|uniref:Leucyl aminopeptidase n=1 Tax=Nitrosomonas communis TaxID=44574 RepID=A0A0F7KIR9_9PROT|nr:MULTISPECIES: leucyl aminopeptidase family protein [Nitrosomonas]AKH39371.1 peptidase M17 [Nitrosomonas communis]TYP85841.1 leucyl aminopeptidase [Nitrosomonas communis]UVS61727.1 leucyl aminopeptidase family protein [Nitrosomonas sp. PLL12]